MTLALSADPCVNLIDAWILDAVLPRGGHVIAQIESYFDESGTHDGSPVLCLAGYILSKRMARLLRREWGKMLGRHKIPYFHMVECAHGNENFAHLSKEEIIEIGKEVIELIKKHTYKGLAVTVCQEDCDRIAPRN